MPDNRQEEPMIESFFYPSLELARRFAKLDNRFSSTRLDCTPNYMPGYVFSIRLPGTLLRIGIPEAVSPEKIRESIQVRLWRMLSTIAGGVAVVGASIEHTIVEPRTREFTTEIIEGLRVRFGVKKSDKRLRLLSDLALEFQTWLVTIGSSFHASSGHRSIETIEIKADGSVVIKTKPVKRQPREQQAELVYDGRSPRS